MANRVIPAASKVLKTIRPLNSASFTTISAISQPIGHAEKAPHLTTTTTNAYTLNLHMVAVELMVDVGMWVMHSRLMQTPLIKDVILGLI
ncbi:hypothetical protein ACFXTO_021825 [Malus domestica]